MEMRDLAVGIGVALALEGALWGAAPGVMRRAMAQLDETPDFALRVSALVALALGVGIVWMARN
jgi:uncharacterized protein